MLDMVGLVVGGTTVAAASELLRRAALGRRLERQMRNVLVRDDR